MADLNKLEEEELVGLQQKLMAERASSDQKYIDQLHSVQRELDKRAALRRFGSLDPAEQEVLVELAKSQAEG